jgi:hypothetical protein
MGTYIQLAIIFGGGGVLLMLVSLIGGGFTVHRIIMPAVGRGPRVLSFGVGSLFVLVAVIFGIQGADTPTAGADPTTTASSPQSQGIILPVSGESGAPVFESSSTSSVVQGVLAAGVRVEILCTVQGDTVTGPGGTSSLWDRISSGYIPDSLIETGTNQATMPSC